MIKYIVNCQSKCNCSQQIARTAQKGIWAKYYNLDGNNEESIELVHFQNRLNILLLLSNIAMEITLDTSSHIE